MQVIEVRRELAFAFDQEEIQGTLSPDGLHMGVTLEKRSKAIPIGIYRAKITGSARLRRDVVRLEKVPGRKDILIHNGNFLHETKGCILIGEYWHKYGIANSNLTLNRLPAMITSKNDIIVSVTRPR
jgi:hypothetical protein